MRSTGLFRQTRRQYVHHLATTIASPDPPAGRDEPPEDNASRVEDVPTSAGSRVAALRPSGQSGAVRNRGTTMSACNSKGNAERATRKREDNEYISCQQGDASLEPVR